MTASATKEDIRLLYIDLFCGAGGTSTGVENAVIGGKKIAKVIACVNHDANAIASHKANHPDAIHYTEDIRTLELGPMKEHVALARKTHPKAKVVLWASLECTNFSRAKGGMSRDADSRTLAEHLFRYVEAIDPDIIQVENVEEFTTAGPLIEKRDKDGNVVMVKKSAGSGKDKRTWMEPAMLPDPEHAGEDFVKWVRQMCSYGYRFEYRILNSADYGAYTSRKRFFGMFAKTDVPLVFPEPTHAKNPEKNLFGEALQPWKPVREVLDLEDEGTSIFGRRKPLVEATLRRILAGLYKFVAGGETAFLTKAFSGDPEGKCSSIDKPAGAVTAKDHHQFITTYYKHGSAHSLQAPAPTVPTKDRISLISVRDGEKAGLFLDNQYGTGVPSSAEEPAHTIGTVPKVKPVRIHFLDNQYGNSRCSSIEQPSGTITGNPKQCLVEAVKDPWVMNTNFNNVGSSINDPCQVVTANRKWHYLVNPQFTCPGNSIEEPCPTVIARQDKKPLSLAEVRTAGVLPPFIKEEDGSLVYEIYDTDSEPLKQIKLFMCAYHIIDITMRMLRIKELKLIQGFPEDYVLCGTQEEQKKYLGNAVVTIMAKVWCEALVDSLFPGEFRKAA
ncbi:MAG: DNA cytosine methyltransferase [Bacteroidales bacterium]|nr:DNA cytosine methyltransferase [Bacteroidales bacterium]